MGSLFHSSVLLPSALKHYFARLKDHFCFKILIASVYILGVSFVILHFHTCMPCLLVCVPTPTLLLRSASFTSSPQSLLFTSFGFVQCPTEFNQASPCDPELGTNHQYPRAHQWVIHNSILMVLLPWDLSVTNRSAVCGRALQVLSNPVADFGRPGFCGPSTTMHSYCELTVPMTMSCLEDGISQSLYSPQDSYIISPFPLPP